MAITDVDSYVDSHASQPAGAPAAPAAAPAESSPNTKSMDQKAWDEFAATHGGERTRVADPKTAQIDVDELIPGSNPDLGQTHKVKKPNPNATAIVTFKDNTSMSIQRTPDGGYAVVDGGTAMSTKSENAGKTPAQIAAESASNVKQSDSSAGASDASARNNNAQAAAQEAQNRGELTPSQQIAADQAAAQKAQSDRDAKIKEIEVQLQAKTLDKDTAIAQATAVYQEYNAKVAAQNAELSRRTAVSNERNSDVGVARDVASMTTSAVAAARPYMMSPEDAANLADSQNRRLAGAGIKGTVRQATSQIPFDPESIARNAMAKTLGGQYGTTPDNPLPARTSFDLGPAPTPPTNTFKPGTDNVDAVNAAFGKPGAPIGPPAGGPGGPTQGAIQANERPPGLPPMPIPAPRPVAGQQGGPTQGQVQGNEQSVPLTQPTMGVPAGVAQVSPGPGPTGPPPPGAAGPPQPSGIPRLMPTPQTGFDLKMAAQQAAQQQAAMQRSAPSSRTSFGIGVPQNLPGAPSAPPTAPGALHWDPATGKWVIG